MFAIVNQPQLGGNMEQMRTHREQMKRHSPLLRSALEEQFRPEDDSAHALCQCEEQLHSGERAYFPLTAYSFVVDRQRNVTSQVWHSHQLNTIQLYYYLHLRRAVIDRGLINV